MEASICNQQKKQTGPDSTQIMLMKNEKIRENYSKVMKTLQAEEQRTAEDLDKMIDDMRKEIRDMDAYNIVYQANSLKAIDRARHKQVYNASVAEPADLKAMIITGGQKTTEPKLLEPSAPTPSLPQGKTTPSLPQGKTTPSLPQGKSIKKVRHRAAKDNHGSRDPFRVKECLQDIEHDLDDRDTKPRPPPVPTQQSASSTPKRSRPVRRSFTAPSQSSHYQSLIPGNCSSYYSIRKFYDQEKDKVILKWSPEEKRKRAVRFVIENLKLPTFSLMRKKTTSAIFRDFRQFKDKSAVEFESDVITPLPKILNITLPNTRRKSQTLSAMSA